MKIRFSALAILLKAMAHRQSWRGPIIPWGGLKCSSHALARSLHFLLKAAAHATLARLISLAL